MLVYDKTALIKRASRWPKEIQIVAFWSFASMHDSVCATATAVAARMRDLFVFRRRRLRCAPSDFAWTRSLLEIPHPHPVICQSSFIVKLVIPACSSRIRFSFMFSELLVACSAWSNKKRHRAAENVWNNWLPLLLRIIDFCNGYLSVQWKTTSTRIVWKDVQKWLDFESPIWLISAAGCYFGSCHGIAKLEKHRCQSSWIESYLSGSLDFWRNKFFPSVFSGTQGKLGLFETAHQRLQGLYIL